MIRACRLLAENHQWVAVPAGEEKQVPMAHAKNVGYMWLWQIEAGPPPPFLRYATAALLAFGGIRWK